MATVGGVTLVVGGVVATFWRGLQAVNVVGTATRPIETRDDVMAIRRLRAAAAVAGQNRPMTHAEKPGSLQRMDSTRCIRVPWTPVPTRLRLPAAGSRVAKGQEERMSL
jgi:hypothetical protein